MSFKSKRVVVTGAEGFIGSHLVEQLLADGAEVKAFCHYNPNADRGWLRGVDVETIFGDIRDQERVFDAIEGSEVVFHLAALIGIPYSYEAPESYVQTNVWGSHNVARGCVRASVARLVHTSTSEVYGTAIEVPINEDHPLQPQSPYSASKIGGDMMAMSFHHAFELPVAIVRPFNTYGPRQSARAVIPAILSQLHQGADKLHVGSTSPTRDFNFVTDTARGFIAVAQCDRAVGQVVNVGSGKEISIGDLIKKLKRITGSGAEVTTDDARIRPSASEVERLLCDNSRAREWAGWEPAVSLDEGLSLTSDWVKENISAFSSPGYQV